MLQFVCLFAALALARAGDVIQLTDADFAAKSADESLLLVKFYAPWCGHCKKIAPEFEIAATSLKENDPPVALAEVDCTTEQSICSKHGVSGYPTLKIFRNGEVSEDYNGPRVAGGSEEIDCDGAGKETCSKYKIQGFPTLKIFKDGVESADYKGQRSSDGIVKYMRGKAGPSSKELKTVAEFEKFVSSNEYVIVGLFSAEDSALAKEFQKLADAMNEDYRFAHSYSKEVHAKSIYENNMVIYQPKQLHNKFDPKERVYEGSASLTEMKTWLNDNIHGFAGLRTSGNANQFKKPLVVAYYSVDYVKNPKGTNYWRNRVMKVAKKMKGAGSTVYFAVSSKDDFSHELSEYGLTAGDTPVVAARDAKDQKFVMKDAFSMDALEKFVTALLAGELKPYLKSEPVPDSNDAPVKVIVAENFDEIVNDKTKDVLIEFYAPWCGHCKSLAPKYDELAEMLAGEKDIVIAKMDATANDVPAQYNVKGFPTLYFAPKNKKDSPVTYDGGREVKEFIKYLAKEATDPLSGYDRDGKKIKKEEL